MNNSVHSHYKTFVLISQYLKASCIVIFNLSKYYFYITIFYIFLCYFIIFILFSYMFIFLYFKNKIFFILNDINCGIIYINAKTIT